MRFEHIEYLTLLILALPMLYFALKNKNSLLSIFSKDTIKKVKASSGGLSQRVRAILLVITYILLIFAIARPQIDNGDIKVNTQSRSLITAIDISKSMLVDDVYPNRFEFAKAKFMELLDKLKSTKVALIGFSTRAFLVSPLTSDINSLKFLAKNLRMRNLNLKGTSILEALKSANNLMKDSKQKAVLIMSDGGDKKDFTQEIEYAKRHNIKVFVYAIGSNKGGVLKENGELVKDKNGNIVVLKRNDAISKLATNTGGVYMIYTLGNQDMAKLAKLLEEKLKIDSTANITIHNREELFYYPLILATITLFMALFSLPRRKIGVDR